jgi:serine/threonine-protein kinase
MAPEQARGKKVDRRADIWAFGVVLYEMAAGGRLFECDTVSDSLAAVIKADPDWTKIPARLERLLRACLQKEPQDRLQAIGDWKLLVDSEPIALSTPSRSRLGMGLGWIAAAVLLAALTLVYFRRAPELTAAPRQILTILPPTGINLRTVGGGSSPEISPDGSSVFEGSSLRRLDSLDMAPLPAMSNEGFWSPDSKSIVFPQGRMLKKMRVPDGAPETIAKLPNFSRGGSWSDKGSILVSSGNLLYVVPPGGGDLRTLEVPSLKQGVYEWPEFLPGSEEFMFFGLLPDSEEGEVYLATLNDGKATDPVALLRNATAAHFTPAGGGLVLFVRNDNLYAQKLNRAKRRLEGDPELVLQGVASGVTNASFSVSRSGTVAWRPGKAALSQWTTFDRKGKQTGISGPPGGQDSVSLSKDESHLLTSRGLESQAWLLEPDRPGRLGAGPGGWLFWYPDGLRLLGASTNALSERLVNGAGTLLKLADIPTDLHAQDVSPDGKLALLSGSNDLYSVRLDGPAVERVPKLAIQTGQRILNARFSPDGQWVVYSSGGLFVQPFPGPGFRKQISSTGSFAVWRKDGKEIVYYDQGQIWSIRVESVGSQQRFSALEALFRVRPPTWLPPPTRSLSRTTARASTSPKPSSSRTQT